MKKEIFKYDKYSLVTRSDFDGLVCAMILKEIGILDDIKFVHPKDVQDGKVELSDKDITTNLPYDSRAGIVFDHHESETIRNKEALGKENYIIDGKAKSAARVVFDFFGGRENPKLNRITDEIMHYVDKADAAEFSKEDILNPQGWDLLSFLMDARTGLGRFRNFTISNYNLMMELIDYCLENDIDAILELPNVKERVDLYNEYSERFKEQLEEISTVDGTVVVVDQRNLETIYPGNRFYIYAMYPEIEISIHLTRGFRGMNTPIMIGKSIINRASQIDIGKICLNYGGGGHKNAGTCQVDNDKADEVTKEIVDYINSN